MRINREDIMENIVNYLKTVTDEYLASLTAHCEDGKLSYYSCSCLIGGSTAKHSLSSSGNYCGELGHMTEARSLPFAAEAETEFYKLGGPMSFDHERRKQLLPLLLAESDRRSKLPQPFFKHSAQPATA
jgi:hypothetical protein